MNKVVLSGRLTRDCLTNTTQSGTATARFTLAVDRRLSKQAQADPNQQKADFISCVAFGTNAQNISTYFHKGDPIVISDARIQTGKYTNKDGVTVYTTDVVVGTWEFPDGKKSDQNGQASAGNYAGGQTPAGNYGGGQYGGPAPAAPAGNFAGGQAPAGNYGGQAGYKVNPPVQNAGGFANASGNGFMNVPEGMDDMPFNQ